MVTPTTIQSIAPGVLTYLEGIPTALVDNHHEAFYWWWESKLKEATLFHVDGHTDMGDANVDYKLGSAKDYTQLNIANFICPAVYHGIVSSIYWLNPHSEERKLQYFGKPISSFFERDVILREQNYKYGWKGVDEESIKKRTGKVIPMAKISVPYNLPLILDIDLDAFCSHRNESLSYLPQKRDDYDGALGFEKRIDETVNILSKIQKPNLITIASSQGNGKGTCYVPPFMVDDVSRYLAINLRKLYGKSRFNH